MFHILKALLSIKKITRKLFTQFYFILYELVKSKLIIIKFVELVEKLAKGIKNGIEKRLFFLMIHADIFRNLSNEEMVQNIIV